MLKQKRRSTIVLFTMAGVVVSLLSLSAHGTGKKKADNDYKEKMDRSKQTSCHSAIELPILEFVPADGATSVRPDTPIQIYFDSDDPTYHKYQKKLQCGHFSVWINCQVQPATFDPELQVITVNNSILERYTDYQVILLVNEKPCCKDHRTGQPCCDGHPMEGPCCDGHPMEGLCCDGHPMEGPCCDGHPMEGPCCCHGHLPQKSKDGEAHFGFQTGSAIGEATHLDANVVKSPVSVTEIGEISVEVTDDYGLPATHATVKVTSDSETLSADELLLEDDDDGKGIIELRDDVAESVELTVTSQDTMYNDPVDTQTWNGTIQFTPENEDDDDDPDDDGGDDDDDDDDDPMTCPGDLPNDYQGEAIVVADTLNVRYGASLDSPVAYTLNEDETVTVRSVVDDEWAFIGYDDSKPVYTSICYLTPTYADVAAYINLGGAVGLDIFYGDYEECHTARIVNGEVYLHWQCLGIIKSFYEFGIGEENPYEYHSNSDGSFWVDGKTIDGISIDGDTHIKWSDIDGLVPHKIDEHYSFTYISMLILQHLAAEHPGNELAEIGQNKFYYRTEDEAEEAKNHIDLAHALYCKKQEEEGPDEAQEYLLSIVSAMAPLKLNGVLFEPGLAITASSLSESFAENGPESADFYIDLATTVVSYISSPVGVGIITFNELSAHIGAGCDNIYWDVDPYGEFFVLTGFAAN